MCPDRSGVDGPLWGLLFRAHQPNPEDIMPPCARLFRAAMSAGAKKMCAMKVATKKRLSKARLCAAALSARVHVEKGPPDADLRRFIGDRISDVLACRALTTQERFATRFRSISTRTTPAQPSQSRMTRMSLTSAFSTLNTLNQFESQIRVHITGFPTIRHGGVEF